MRRFPPFEDGVSVLYAQLNRGKEVVELDLKASDAMTQLDPLLASADILVEQFRPGVMERLGLGYESLSARFPELIYCSISATARTARRRKWPATISTIWP